LSASDKSVYCFFHQNFEALEIPFNRNTETTEFVTMTLCPVTGPSQSSGSCSKEPNSNHPPATIFSRCCSMRLSALFENQDRARRSSFVSAEEIQQNATAGLTAIPKQDFQRGLQQWSDCRSRCLCAEGQYLNV